MSAAPDTTAAVAVASDSAGDIRSAGYEMKGPSALAGDWRRFWALAFTIARNEFKLKFFGSVLGYVWQVMRPLLLFGVLYIFFTKVSNPNVVGKGDKFYGAQLLGSVVLFTFFAEATQGAVRSVVDRENLVRKIQFPRLVIPTAVVLLGLFNLVMNLIVVLIFSLLSGVRPMLSWLELPLILAMLVVVATGMAMLLSALFVHFRDIQPIWEVASQILFYASPVILSVATVLSDFNEPKHHEFLYKHQFLQHIYFLNPLVAIFQQFRHAMIYHGTPSAGEAMGSWVALLEPMAIVVAIFVVGFVVFNRLARQIAENL